MRTWVICGLAAGATTFLPISPASAFLPSQPGLELGGDVVQIARKSRPPGWNRGRKVGWGKGTVPPGQRGKR
jgi:hypothetical protein